MFFCKSIEEVLKDSFTDKNNKALIKASAFLDDIIGDNVRHLQLRRCIPIEIQMIGD